MKKAYYYMTHVTHAISRGIMYFKAVNKKQIKQYFADNHISFITIFDPYARPIDGVTYIDISNY